MEPIRHSYCEGSTARGRDVVRVCELGGNVKVRETVVDWIEGSSFAYTGEGAPLRPPELRSLGSPTILIDGVDVVKGDASESCCRLYPDSDQRGAPPLAAIQEALRRSQENRRP